MSGFILLELLEKLECRGRPPVDGALEANKRSIIMLTRNCDIFMIASNKFSLFGIREVLSTFRRTEFVLAIYCSQNNISLVHFERTVNWRSALHYKGLSMTWWCFRCSLRGPGRMKRSNSNANFSVQLHLKR